MMHDALRHNVGLVGSTAVLVSGARLGVEIVENQRIKRIHRPRREYAASCLTV
jgi:hypothetical protein